MPADQIISRIPKLRWIEMYGGQAILDAEGFRVVPCVNCDDSICHGWRVEKLEVKPMGDG